MRYTLLFIIFYLTLNTWLPSNAYSETDHKLPNSPQELTQFFCNLDLEGARLSTDSYRKSDIPKFLVPGEFKSPGWDTVVLVSRYKIEKENIKDDQASVTVIYDVIGNVSNDLIVMKHKEPYTFKFRKQSSKWVLIEPYDLPQHISIDTAIRHLEDLLKIQGEVEPSTTAVINKLKQLKEGLKSDR